MKGSQADAWAGCAANTFAKRWKRRYERRKAKRDPECQATYHKYKGWIS